MREGTLSEGEKRWLKSIQKRIKEGEVVVL